MANSCIKNKGDDDNSEKKLRELEKWFLSRFELPIIKITKIEFNFRRRNVKFFVNKNKKNILMCYTYKDSVSFFRKQNKIDKIGYAILSEKQLEKFSNIVIEKTGYFLKSYTLYKDRHMYDSNGWSLCINFSDGSTVESGGHGFEDAFPKLADDLMTYFVRFIRRSGTIMTNKKYKYWYDFFTALNKV